MLKKPVVEDQIINLDQMDAATCANLKGKLNERGECLVKAQENQDDPDTLVLRAMKYKPAMRNQKRGFSQG